jgi:hypothetical protein
VSQFVVSNTQLLIAICALALIHVVSVLFIFTRFTHLAENIRALGRTRDHHDDKDHAKFTKEKLTQIQLECLETLNMLRDQKRERQRGRQNLKPDQTRKQEFRNPRETPQDGHSDANPRGGRERKRGPRGEGRQRQNNRPQGDFTVSGRTVSDILGSEKYTPSDDLPLPAIASEEERIAHEQAEFARTHPMGLLGPTGEQTGEQTGEEREAAEALDRKVNGFGDGEPAPGGDS